MNRGQGFIPQFARRLGRIWPGNWRDDHPLTVAVLGAGNGGLAMAADLALAGHSVRLFNRGEERLRPIVAAGGVALVDNERAPGPPLLARFELVTADPAAAVRGAELLMVVVPATGHRYLATALAPVLTDGQVVVLNPGRTGGALEFRATLDDEGCLADVTVAEASTFLFAARAVGPAQARIYGRKRKVTFAALPSSRNAEVAALLDRAYPGRFAAASSVLETSLDNIGAVFHPAITLLNAGRIEDQSSEFEFYRTGASPGVVRVIEAVDAERCGIASALGVPHVTALEWMKQSYSVEAEDLHGALQANPGYGGIMAPAGLRHRYLTEDVPTSLVPMASLARLADVPSPNIDSLIGLASTIHGVDYAATGRTVRRLGLDGAGVDDILAHVAVRRSVA